MKMHEYDVLHQVLNESFNTGLILKESIYHGTTN